MRRALTALLLVILSVACSGNTSAPKAYSEDDLRWLERLGRWETKYFKATSKADSTYTEVLAQRKKLEALRDAVQPMRQCAQTLEKEVGLPQNGHLRSAFEFFTKACQEDGKFATAWLKSFTSGIDQSAERAEAFAVAHALTNSAYRHIEQGLLANRPLPVDDGITTRSRIEPRLGRVASQIALKRVEVRCWSPSEWPRALKEWEAYTGSSDAVGFAVDPNRANLDPPSCATLVRFLYRRWRPMDDFRLGQIADALGLLAHEAEHLLDSAADEAVTECHAAQDVARVARLLGAGRPLARRLAVIYWEQTYPFQDDEYRSPECKNNGLFDRKPETDVFP